MADAVVGTLRALLTMDSAQFESGVRKAQDSMKVFAKDAHKLGAQATALGSSLTRTLTLPIVAAGAGFAKAAMDFESSFAGVRKTVQATEPEFAKMAQAFRDLSKTIPVNVNELNRLGEAAGALGIPKAEIVDFSRVMALLGVTTNVTADQAAESIAKIQNIFGAAGKDTERFASSLVALGNSGASTESQILEMATRIAGAGNAIGMTQGQVLGFASALSSVGIEAEMGGSAISRVFIDIAGSVSKGGAELDNFAKVAGMSTTTFTKAFKEDAAGAVTAFIEGLGKVKTSGGDLLGVLEQLGFSEIRIRDTLLRTAGASGELRKALDIQGDAWQKNNALSVEAGERFKTTASQLGILWNQIKDVGITIGNALLPLIKSTVDAFDAFLPVIAKVAQFFANLPAPVQAVVVGFGLLAAAAGPVLFVAGQLITSWGLVAGAFATGGLAARGLTLAMGLLTPTLGAAAVAVASLTAVVAAGYQAWQLYKEHAERGAAATRQLTTDQANLVRINEATGRSFKSIEEATAWVQKGGLGVPKVAIDSHVALAPVVAKVAMSVDLLAASGKKAKVEVDQFQQAVGRLVDRLSGSDLVSTASQWVAAIEQIGGIGALTHDELQQFQDDIVKAVEKMRLMGMEIPRTWRLIADSVRNSGLLQATQEQLGESLRMVGIYKTQLLLETRDISGRMAAAISAVPAAIHSENISGALDSGLVGPVRRATGFVEGAFRGMGSAVAGVIQNMLSKISGMLSGWLDKFLPGWAAQLVGGLSTSMMSAGANAILGMAGVTGASGGGLGGMLGLGGSVAGAGASVAGVGGAAAGAGGGIGAGGTAAGVAGGIGIGTTVALTGGAAAAGVLAWAIYKKGLFRGGEEALKVNPARDKFLMGFGGAGVDEASGFQRLAATLTEITGEAGGGHLFTALKQADTMAKFDAAVAAIETAVAKSGNAAEKATDIVTDGVDGSTSAFGELTAEVNGTTEALLRMAKAGLSAAIATGSSSQMASAQRAQNQQLTETPENRNERQAGSSAAVSAFLQSRPELQQEASSFLSRNPNDYDRLARMFGLPGFHRGGFIRAHDGMFLGAPRPGEMDIRALTGESVLNRMATQRLGGESGINAINRGNVASASVTRGGDVYTNHNSISIRIDGVGKNAEALAQELAPKILRSIARHSPEGSRQLFKKMVNSVSKDAPSA